MGAETALGIREARPVLRHSGAEQERSSVAETLESMPLPLPNGASGAERGSRALSKQF